MNEAGRKYLPVVTDFAPVREILQRALEILKAEGNRDYMWGYEQITRAAAEMGYASTRTHMKAATLFVNACNSAEIKIAAIEKVLKEI